MCVKSCPLKDTEYECYSNVDSDNECPKLYAYDSELLLTNCLPSEKSGKEAFDVIKENLEKDPTYGTMMKYF